MKENTNMSVLSIGKVIEHLSNAYTTVINSNKSVTLLPSVMLWGPPGVGKSQGVKQLASDLEVNTGKKVNVTDVRLLLFNPIDLRGIPTSNADKTLAIWLKPKIFHMDDNSDVINILFLDELSAAPQSVQAAAYQITLDRTVGEHKLPENCIVIAAGNRVTDKSVAFKMPKALANRLCHMEIKSDFESWKKWAVLNGINEKVIGFLSFRQTALDQFGTDDMLAFPTPRSWEMTSNILSTVSANVEDVYPLVSGCIGSGTAIEFRTWVKVYDQLPSMEDIFSGMDVKVPSSPDSLYAVVSTMVAHARRHQDDIDAIANSIKYALKMPPDFATILLKDYFVFSKDFKKQLMKLPELMKWLQRSGKYLV